MNSATGQLAKMRDLRKGAWPLACAMALSLGLVDEARAQGSDVGKVGAERSGDNPEAAVERGEAAVSVAPQDAALRAGLGRAYLRAGRFAAANHALSDAAALGDVSGHTTLLLALTQIACGQNRAALATLDHGGQAIPPADLGLALALAGDTGRGIAVLTEGVRDGSVTPLLRQNLAYAYALDGRWADARLTAGFDLPPDQVEMRLQLWARTMEFGQEQVRIARLLDVPVSADQGMPVRLALTSAVTVPQLAAAPVVPQADVADPVPVLAAAPAPPVIAAPIVLAAWPTQARQVAHARMAIGTPDHVVQLGAFSSARNAERARTILVAQNPQLRGHGLVITQAVVHGRNFWRVAATGFAGAAAADACASLKRRGGACFAYAPDHAPQDHARQEKALALATTRSTAAIRRR